MTLLLFLNEEVSEQQNYAAISQLNLEQQKEERNFLRKIDILTKYLFQNHFTLLYILF